MKVVIYTAIDEVTGAGHFVRMSALAFYLRQEGHAVTFMCNEPGLYGDKGVPHASPRHIELGYKPDWLVYDMPGETPKWVTHRSWKACVIDGIGHPESNGALVISQGLEGEYCAPGFLILRPELAAMAGGNWTPNRKMLVFGGAEDDMRLLRYVRIIEKELTKLIGSWVQIDYVGKDKAYSSRDWFYQLPRYDFAIVAMGMIVWELVAVGVPTFVFSKTDRHLRSAKLMEREGYCVAWDRTGLPAMTSDFLGLIGQPNDPNQVTDGRGGYQLVKLLESRLK